MADKNSKIAKIVMILCLFIFFHCNLQISLCFPKSFRSQILHKRSAIQVNKHFSKLNVIPSVCIHTEMYNVKYLQMRCSSLSKCLFYFTFRCVYMRARSH